MEHLASAVLAMRRLFDEQEAVIEEQRAYRRIWMIIALLSWATAGMLAVEFYRTKC